MSMIYYFFCCCCLFLTIPKENHKNNSTRFPFLCQAQIQTKKRPTKKQKSQTKCVFMNIKNRPKIFQVLFHFACKHKQSFFFFKLMLKKKKIVYSHASSSASSIPIAWPKLVRSTRYRNNSVLV